MTAIWFACVPPRSPNCVTLRCGDGLLIVENGPLGATWRARAITVELARAAAGGIQGPFSLQLDGADSMSLDPAERATRTPPGTIAGTLAIDTSRAVKLTVSAHVPDPAGLAAGVGRLKDAPLPQAAVSLERISLSRPR